MKHVIKLNDLNEDEILKLKELLKMDTFNQIQLLYRLQRK